MCSSSCGAMAVSRWVPFQLVSLLEMPAAEPHKQPEEEWFPLNRETRVHGFLLWLNRVWRLSSRPDSSLLPQKALSYTFSCIQWGVGSNPPILHMSKPPLTNSKTKCLKPCRLLQLPFQVCLTSNPTRFLRSHTASLPKPISWTSTSTHLPGD